MFDTQATDTVNNIIDKAEKKIYFMILIELTPKIIIDAMLERRRILLYDYNL